MYFCFWVWWEISNTQKNYCQSQTWSPMILLKKKPVTSLFRIVELFFMWGKKLFRRGCLHEKKRKDKRNYLQSKVEIISSSNVNFQSLMESSLQLLILWKFSPTILVRSASLHQQPFLNFEGCLSQKKVEYLCTTHLVHTRCLSNSTWMVKICSSSL